MLIADSKKIWPCADFDMILTLGTGFSSPSQGTSPARFRGRIRNGTLARLLRWSQARLVEAIDPEEVNERVKRSLDDDERSRYFRWNLRFAGEKPRLDDVQQMQHIRDQVSVDPCEEMLADIKIAMIASSFFFELRGIPKYCRDGTYLCEGTVRIRGNPNVILDLLASLNPERAEFVRRGEELDDVHMAGAICPHCKLFGQRVQFHVLGHNDRHAICLRLGKDKDNRISGFPQSMTWFCERQGLYDVFSTQASKLDQCVCNVTPKLALLENRKRNTPAQSYRGGVASRTKVRKIGSRPSWFF